MISNFQVPTRISFGKGALVSLSPAPGKVLLFTSASVPKRNLDELETRLVESGVEIVRFIKPEGEPKSRDINEAFARLSGDLVAAMGVGGGSVLDFTKALALLAASGGKIEDYEFGGREIKGALPTYMAPTTCGSGSEVTPYAVISNSNTGRKFTIAHSVLRPVQAAVDTDFLRLLPLSTALTTSLDAFIHCLEAVLTRGDTRLVAPVAKAGLAIGWSHLPRLAAGDWSDDLLEDLARLSLFGGISIAHSRTGLIHTLSVAFSEFVDAPHGLLNAHILPFALEHNMPGYGGLLASVVGQCSGEKVSTDAEAYAYLMSWLRNLIGGDFLLTKISLRQHKEHILRRVMQDAGLATVSHGTIDDAALTRTLDRIFDAIRL